MNSSEPWYRMVFGREGLASSQVSFTQLVIQSIHRRSAAERASAWRKEEEVMLMVMSSRLIRISLYLSFCCNKREFVEPTIYDFVP